MLHTAIYELLPFISNQRSFYGKANFVIENNNGKTKYILLSYLTPVCVIETDFITQTIKFPYKKWTATTGRHIKDFLYQKSDLEKVLYMALNLHNAKNIKQLMETVDEITINF